MHRYKTHAIFVTSNLNDMENLKFYKNPNRPDSFIAVAENIFVSQIFSETYDQYGQPVGCQDAGDGLIIKSQKALKVAKKNGLSSLKIGDPIYACNGRDDAFAFFQIIENLQEGDYEMEYVYVDAHSFFNGHSWQTVYKDELEEVDEETQNTLMRALENKEFCEQKFGNEIFTSEHEGDKYEIISRNSAFWTFEINYL